MSGVSKIVIAVYAVVFLVLHSPPVDAREIIGTCSAIPTGGCRIEFDASSSVDLVVLPPDSPEVFGRGRRGKAVIVRGATSMTVGRLDETYDEVFRIRLQEPLTSWIEIVPIVTEPAESAESASAAEGRIYIAGTDPSRRSLESELDSLSRAALEFQRNNRCFSCHITLPLAWTATLAEFRCMSTPRAILASIAENLVSLQQSDGSFAAPGHPEYGIVSPTLAGAAALTHLQKFCDDLDLTPALRRAAGFLIARAAPGEIPEFDFTFPPLFIGTSFAARLFLTILEAIRDAGPAGAVTFDPRLAEHLERASGVLDSTQDAFAEDLWRHFSISVAGGAPGAPIGTDSLSFLKKTVSGLSGDRDPELSALCEGVLREHGHSIEAPTIPEPRPDEIKKRIWRLYQRLLRESAER